MGFSNLVALAILVTAAATLNRSGIHHVDSAAQAAEALRPIAGNFAFALFALGIVGTGLLAVPVLAGSAAYAAGEAEGWPVGLARKPLQAKAFYGAIGVATLLGAVSNMLALSPITALVWVAVINGVLAVPVMVMLMVMARSRPVMGRVPHLSASNHDRLDRDRGDGDRGTGLYRHLDPQSWMNSYLAIAGKGCLESKACALRAFGCARTNGRI